MARRVATHEANGVKLYRAVEQPAVFVTEHGAVVSAARLGAYPSTTSAGTVDVTVALQALAEEVSHHIAALMDPGDST